MSYIRRLFNFLLCVILYVFLSCLIQPIYTPISSKNSNIFISNNNLKVNIDPMGCKIHDIIVKNNLDFQNKPRSLFANVGQKKKANINNFFTVNYGTDDKIHKIRWDVEKRDNTSVTLKNKYFFGKTITRKISLNNNKLKISDNLPHTNHLYHKQIINMYNNNYENIFTKSHNELNLQPNFNNNGQNINTQVQSALQKPLEGILYGNVHGGFFGFSNHRNLFISDTIGKISNQIHYNFTKSPFHIEKIGFIQGKNVVNEFTIGPASYEFISNNKSELSPMFFSGMLSGIKYIITSILNGIINYLTPSMKSFFLFCILISSLSIPFLLTITYNKLSNKEQLNQLFMEHGNNIDKFKTNFFNSRLNNSGFLFQTIFMLMETAVVNIIPLWLIPKIISESILLSRVSFLWLPDITQMEFSPWTCLLKRITHGFLEVNILSILATFIVYNNFTEQFSQINMFQSNQQIKYILLFVIYLIFIKQQSIGYLIFICFHMEYQNLLKEFILHFIL